MDFAPVRSVGSGTGAQKYCNVNVVPAGMHHAYFAAGIVLRSDFARVGQFRHLLNGERVKFGAHVYCWAIPILQLAHHAVSHPFRMSGVLPDMLCDRIPQSSEFTGNKSRGFFFVMR